MAKLGTLKTQQAQRRLKPKEMHKATTTLATMISQVFRDETKHVHPFNLAGQLALFRKEIVERHQNCVGDARSQSIHVIQMLVDCEVVHRGIKEDI